MSLSAAAAGSERGPASCPSRATPPISYDADGNASLEIDVMLYNIEGLPFPARLNRTPDLEQLAKELAAMRRACDAPQIVVVQEAFSTRAASVGLRAGYTHIAHGPDADDSRLLEPASLTESFLEGQRLSRGEGMPKLVNGGLQILSDFWLEDPVSAPFSANACAGTDCLSNKGAMIVRVRIPGVPAPVEVLNSHMNSRKGAGVSYARTDAAHRAQTDELAHFLAVHRRPDLPLLVAGDFNMKEAKERFRHFEQRMPQSLVHRACARGACALMVPHQTDQPWMETQDLHAFDSSPAIRITPVRLIAAFDGRNRPALSDHIATIVTYRLSWRAEDSVQPT